MRHKYWRRNWTPEARQQARDRALAHPEWVDKSRAAFVEKYPDFLRAYYAAFEHPQPCDTCDGEGRPVVDRLTFELITWRCYECRKDRSRAET